MKESLADRLVSVFDALGANTLYAVTVLCVLITLSYWKDFQNWEEIPDWNRWLAASAVFASAVFVLLSLLNLAGIASF